MISTYIDSDDKFKSTIIDQRYLSVSKEVFIERTKYVIARLIASEPYYDSAIFGTHLIRLNIESLEVFKNETDKLFGMASHNTETLYAMLNDPLYLSSLFWNKKMKLSKIDTLLEIPKIVEYIYDILIPKIQTEDIIEISSIFATLRILFDYINLSYTLLKPKDDDIIDTSFNSILDKTLSLEYDSIDEMMNETYLEDTYDTISLEAKASDENKADGISQKMKIEKEDIEKKKTSIGEKIIQMNKAKEKSKLRIKFFLDKISIPKKLFYKKHLGKIDHLYEQYGKEAMMQENELLGDPVKILLNKVPNYLARISKEVYDAYTNFTKHYDSLMTSLSMSEVINKTNKYITYSKVKLNPTDKTSKIMKSIKKDFRYKIGIILLKDNKVYGYTPESIAEKKYPPIQHLIVSLFIANPHEKPKEMSVADIFDSAESFKIMESRMKKIVLDTANAMNSGFTSVKIDVDLENYAKQTKDYKSNIMNKTSGPTGINEKELKKIKSLLNSYLSMFNAYIPIFLYVMSGGSTMYNMVIRIDKMCREAITKMLAIEDTKKDKTHNYKTGDKVTDDDGIKQKKKDNKNFKKELNKDVIVR